MDDAREDVAPDRIGAEQELRAAALLPDRWRQQVVAILSERLVRRDDVGEDGAEHDDADHDEAADRAPVLAEVCPELAQRPRRRRGAQRDGIGAELGARHPLTSRAGCAG